MATEEIQISELELADSLLEDMLFPIESATDTNAATLLQLKKWLGSSLPTGFIIASLGKMNDSRFTLLDGKTLSRTGTYSDFCNKVIEQVQLGNWFACSQSEYDEDLSSKGQCGRFVIETDYIRIPTLGKSLCSGIVNGTIPVVGNGMTLGLLGSNAAGSDLINGGLVSTGGDVRTTPEAYGTNIGSTTGNTAVFTSTIGITTDPTKSGIEGKINSVEVYYYMVISTEGQTTPISVDINKVYEDINLKANKDLSDVTQLGKETVVGWGMPDYSAIVSVGNTTRTPTTDVVVHCDKVGVSSVGSITISGHTFNVSKADSNGANNRTYRSFYIRKGTEYTTKSLTEVLEIPLLGAK